MLYKYRYANLACMSQKEPNQETLHQIQKETYQLTVLECVEHLNVTAALAAIKVGYVLPKPVNPSEGQQPLGIDLPCVPMKGRKKKIRLK